MRVLCCIFSCDTPVICYSHQIGIVGVTAAAFATIPLCFDLNTCLVFNEQYVTTEVAQDKDLETWLEVGQW